QPYYRLVAIDRRAKRDGRPIETPGDYNPRPGEGKLTFDEARVEGLHGKSGLGREDAENFVVCSGVLEGPLGLFLIYPVRELVQCQVYTLQGECLGSVVDVLPSGGNDIFVVRQGDKEILIPATKQVVRLIDLAGKRVEVELPQGLREIYEA